MSAMDIHIILVIIMPYKMLLMINGLEIGFKHIIGFMLTYRVRHLQWAENPTLDLKLIFKHKKYPCRLFIHV